MSFLSLPKLEASISFESKGSCTPKRSFKREECRTSYSAERATLPKKKLSLPNELSLPYELSLPNEPSLPNELSAE
ncbi:hypothetical protein CEXT_343701 [Caerostris extrusa]|uniref:Uncharacterized protein n=1 Tax=Caerostris extrusa TaxID=172846 RepID=A0AAV4TJ21_CAEEX|nr:hypothetical protein CEXT_343701 [Caerostris extrusa]